MAGHPHGSTPRQPDITTHDQFLQGPPSPYLHTASHQSKTGGRMDWEQH